VGFYLSTRVAHRVGFEPGLSGLVSARRESGLPHAAASALDDCNARMPERHKVLFPCLEDPLFRLFTLDTKVPFLSKPPWMPPVTI